MTRFSMFNGARRAATPALLLLTVLTAACSERAITGPAVTLPEFAAPAFATTGSAPLSQTLSADTVVTVFVLGTDKRSTTQSIGFGSSIRFPLGAASVCNIAKSSYGVGTWDSACAAATSKVTITAKVWMNAKGKLSSEFSPAMRFVPAANNAVMLTFLDNGSGTRIDYCTLSTCVNEALNDATVSSQKSTTTTTLPSSMTSSWSSGSEFTLSVPQVSRRIKHFSGYTVTAD